MLNRKLVLPIIFMTLLLLVGASIIPVYAADYNPGVMVGQYIKYGNFSGNGQGFEDFNNYGFLELAVTAVSASQVTLLSTGQYKTGTALPGNGTTAIWDIQAGTQDGTPATQGPIIAANLNQGDAIPPPDTYAVNSTEQRTYLGVSRAVNVLAVTVASPDYNSSLNYVYDRASGILLEASAQTTTQAEPEPVSSSFSYSVVETNVFSPIPSSTLVVDVLALPFVLVVVAIVITALVIIVALIVLLRRR